MVVPSKAIAIALTELGTVQLSNEASISSGSIPPPETGRLYRLNRGLPVYPPGGCRTLWILVHQSVRILTFLTFPSIRSGYNRPRSSRTRFLICCESSRDCSAVKNSSPQGTHRYIPAFSTATDRVPRTPVSA